MDVVRDFLVVHFVVTRVPTVFVTVMAAASEAARPQERGAILRDLLGVCQYSLRTQLTQSLDTCQTRVSGDLRRLEVWRVENRSASARHPFGGCSLRRASLSSPTLDRDGDGARPAPIGTRRRRSQRLLATSRFGACIPLNGTKTRVFVLRGRWAYYAHVNFVII